MDYNLEDDILNEIIILKNIKSETQFIYYVNFQNSFKMQNKSYFSNIFL
jgi:hypothetical protein